MEFEDAIVKIKRKMFGVFLLISARIPCVVLKDTQG